MCTQSTRKRDAPFLGLPDQSNVGLAHAPALRLARVLRPVEHKHLTRDSLSRDEVGILGHVPRAVDLPGVVDLLNDLYPGLRWERMASELPPVIVVVCTVKFVR